MSEHRILDEWFQLGLLADSFSKPEFNHNHFRSAYHSSQRLKELLASIIRRPTITRLVIFITENRTLAMKRIVRKLERERQRNNLAAFGPLTQCLEKLRRGKNPMPRADRQRPAQRSKQKTPQ